MSFAESLAIKYSPESSLGHKVLLIFMAQVSLWYHIEQLPGDITLSSDKPIATDHKTTATKNINTKNGNRKIELWIAVAFSGFRFYRENRQVYCR